MNAIHLHHAGCDPYRFDVFPGIGHGVSLEKMRSAYESHPLKNRVSM